MVDLTVSAQYLLCSMEVQWNTKGLKRVVEPPEPNSRTVRSVERREQMTSTPDLSIHTEVPSWKVLSLLRDLLYAVMQAV